MLISGNPQQLFDSSACGQFQIRVHRKRNLQILDNIFAPVLILAQTGLIMIQVLRNCANTRNKIIRKTIIIECVRFDLETGDVKFSGFFAYLA